MRLTGWPRLEVREVCALLSQLSSLGSNPDLAINCHFSVSQAGWFNNLCVIPRTIVKLGVPSGGISRWTLKIPRCPSQRVDELSPTPRPNSCPNYCCERNGKPRSMTLGWETASADPTLCNTMYGSLDWNAEMVPCIIPQKGSVIWFAYILDIGGKVILSIVTS